MEYWIFPTTFATYTSKSTVIGNQIGPSADTAYWTFGPLSDGTVCFFYYTGSANFLTTSTAIPVNTWTHLAFVNNAGSLTIYINGVSSATGSISGSPQINTSVPLLIGNTNGTSTNFYMSNLRITNTAVYTSGFTPPTAPLTAISGTQLLTANAPTFTDASSNNFTIANYGDYIASQNPFGASYAGGGGGGGTTTIGYAGMGGGGNGALRSSSSAGSAGATNTGGGAGGSTYYSVSAAGGSGIVILAYPSSYPDATSVTNGTKTTSGGFKIYTFLTNGSITF